MNEQLVTEFIEAVKSIKPTALLLGVQETAQLLNCSVSTFKRKYLSRHDFPQPIRSLDAPKWKRKEIEKWVDRVK